MKGDAIEKKKKGLYPQTKEHHPRRLHLLGHGSDLKGKQI